MPSIRLSDTGSERRPRKQMHERTYKDGRYNGRRWRKLRTHVLREDPTCKDCGRVATVVDHITPVRLGGSFYEVENLQGLCASCHNAKSARERHQTPKGGRGVS